ncbi:MAG: RIP metalloprotease RseP [Caldisericia bacterium]|nr:RIP metalloprotease RseP [Caldisericia bacterium]
MGYIYALLGLALIILVHEWGHYLAAKKNGIVVERFGIGMGPTIKIGKFEAHWYRDGTEFCWCWIPLGGFCQMKGEDDEKQGDGTYNSASPLAKFWVAFSGPFANFVTAFVILFVIFSFIGNPLETQVHGLMDGYPAAEAGILPGDRIIGVNETLSDEWSKLQPLISENADELIHLTISRNGEDVNLDIIPKNDSGIGMLGIMIGPSNEPVGILRAVKMSLDMMWNFFTELLKFVGKAITGQLGGVKVTGPVGIIKMAGESANSSSLAFLFFIAFLSLNLGMFNLFPIPPLDGGKIVFAFYEGVTKKRVSKKVELAVSTVGFILLIGMLLFVTYKDIVGLFAG